jgi:hypothetical protein
MLRQFYGTFIILGNFMELSHDSFSTTYILCIA